MPPSRESKRVCLVAQFFPFILIINRNMPGQTGPVQPILHRVRVNAEYDGRRMPLPVRIR